MKYRHLLFIPFRSGPRRCLVPIAGRWWGGWGEWAMQRHWPYRNHWPTLTKPSLLLPQSVKFIKLFMIVTHVSIHLLVRWAFTIGAWPCLHFWTSTERVWDWGRETEKTRSWCGQGSSMQRLKLMQASLCSTSDLTGSSWRADNIPWTRATRMLPCAQSKHTICMLNHVTW